MTVITSDKVESDETQGPPVEVEEVAEKTQTDLTKTDGDSGCDSDVSVISLGSESSDDENQSPSCTGPGHSCVYCDKVFETRDQLAHHNSEHAVTAPSPLVASIEDSIYERILVEEKQAQMEEDKNTEKKSSSIGDPNTSALSDTILDNYDSLIEDLISSVSPDELLEKIVITQEIPDSFEENVLQEIEKGQAVETAQLQPLENPKTTQKDDVKTISILAKSSRAKARPKTTNEMQVEHSSQEGIPKVIQFKRKRTHKEKGHGGTPKMAKKGHEMEDIEFANFINDKAFKILSQREENTGAEIVLNASSSSDKVEEEYDPNRWLPAHMDEGPCKVRPPSQKRLKRFLASEKMHMERDYKVREKCGQSEESLRVQKTKSTKRGRLGWMVKMETKNFHCPRKAVGWRWEDEETGTEEDDKKLEPDDLEEFKSQTAPSDTEGSLEQRVQDKFDQEDVSEDEDDPDEMDFNEDDRASKLLDSLLLEDDSIGVSETRPISEDITASSSQSIGANVSMPVFEF